MQTLRLLTGSIVVYAIVACETAMTGPASDAAAVHEAAAQSLSPTMATEKCDVKVVVTSSSTPVTAVYAEHAFPGRSATQLAAVQALGTFGASYASPPEYSQTQTAAYVRDGYAAALCGNTTDMYFTSVTFILPQ